MELLGFLKLRSINSLLLWSNVRIPKNLEC